MNQTELERAGALRFQAERVSVPETREKFLKEAADIEKKAKVEIKETIKSKVESIKKPKEKEKKLKINVNKFVSGALKGKMVNKGIVRDVSRRIVEIHQRRMGLQKMDRDKSRFFSPIYEQEKRSLFFQ